MATTAVYTFSDVVNHLLDWRGNSTTDAVMLRIAKRAVEAAYREVVNCRNWSYYMSQNRLDTVASYSTGTIDYDHTGGSSERLVTLASGTWPSWAAHGILQIAGVEYNVASRLSSTTLQLSVNSNPGADVAASTTYYIWRDTYPLPVNFKAMGSVRESTKNIVLDYLEPNAYMAQRIYKATPSQPINFTIVSDPDYIGVMAMRFWPPPDAIYHYDYAARRGPRQFTQPKPYTTGTVASSSTTITGTSTVFASSMLGCVIRFSPVSTAAVTGTEGANPFLEQRIITAYTSATSITIDQALTNEVSGVTYEISDPIDVESGAMYTAFLRRAEYEMANLMQRDDTPKSYQLAQQALIQASEMDSRVFDNRPGSSAWSRVPQYWDLANVTT